jgi:hypothetical protein
MPNQLSRNLGAMRSSGTAFLIAVLMLAASVGAMLAKPTAKLSDQRPAMSLESTIPRAFGDWREEPQAHMQVVNPQAAALVRRGIRNYCAKLGAPAIQVLPVRQRKGVEIGSQSCR